MRKIILLLALLSIPAVFAEESLPLTVPQNVSFETCTKLFAVNQEKLFYLTLGSIAANRFTVEEIQTANGYVLFSVNKNKYLATVASVDSANAILKITPCNNNYNFPPGIITNTYKYIDLNLNKTL